MDRDRIAILGGSFDPVHLGHLFLLHCAVSMSGYSRFLIIPAKVSNFKQDNIPKADDQDRLEMLRLALEDYRELYPMDGRADISISDLELRRGGVSYTSDTIRELKATLGLEGRIGMVMGDDHIGGLSRWHDFAYLKDNVEFLICRRQEAGPSWESIPEGIVYRKLEPQALAKESSSGFRSSPGSSYGFLPKRVAEYVRNKNLYH